MEDHTHYLCCQDKSIKKIQKEKQQIIIRELKRMKTYPGIIHAIVLVLTEGPQKAIELMDLPNNNIDDHIHSALLQQQALGNCSLEKGFISKQWHKAQRLWNKEKKTQHWNRNIIQLLQHYTLEIKKERNQRIHGKTSQQERIMKQSNLQKRIQELYTYDRKLLILQERKLFKLPLSQRLKHSTDKMTLWIDMAEYAFQTKVQIEERKTIHWYFPKKSKK